MFENVRMTVKKLLSDKRGEDLAEVSSGLSKGAKTCIALGAITAAASGTAALSNSANSASDTAAEKVVSPVGAQASKSQSATAVYR